MRAPSKRYLAGFALVADKTLEMSESHPAPADRDEEGQLAELHRICADLIERYAPDFVAIKVSEAQGPSLAVAHHAEGVALAAAGAAGTEVRKFHRAGLWKPAGLDGKAKMTDIAAALCAQLDSVPTASGEQQAAAAARAVVVAG